MRDRYNDFEIKMWAKEFFKIRFIDYNAHSYKRAVTYAFRKKKASNNIEHKPQF